MDFTEKSIEDLIYETIKSGNIKELHDRGIIDIHNFPFFCRQVDLGQYGRLDLVGINYIHKSFDIGCFKSLEIAVFEIKKGEINISTFLQAVRYCKGIEQYLSDYGLKANFKIYLIGSTINKSDFCYITDFVENLNIYTIKLDLKKGIYFKSEYGYHITGNSFKIHNDINNTVKKLMLDKVKKTFCEQQFLEIDDDLPF